MNQKTVDLPDQVRAVLIPTVAEVFNTMFGIDVKPAALLAPVSEQVVLVGSVSFIGDVDGVVFIRLMDSFARILTGKMLGLPDDELDDAMVNDVVGEISNMVVGSIKSHLCDQGVACVLTIPSVVRGKDLSVEPIQCAERRIISFRAEDHDLQFEIFIKSNF